MITWNWLVDWILWIFGSYILIWLSIALIVLGIVIFYLITAFLGEIFDKLSFKGKN